MICRGVEFIFKFLSDNYTNPNTNPSILTTVTLTLTGLTDIDDAFERFCAHIFCDFIRNYFALKLGHFVTRIHSAVQYGADLQPFQINELRRLSIIKTRFETNRVLSIILSP